MNKRTLAGLLGVGILVLAALFAPVLTPYAPNTQSVVERLTAPSVKHILGTDELGRDVLSRMLYGGRVSMSVGIIAVLIATFIGLLVGALAGYYGGVMDNIIMRTVDIILTIPTLFVILMIVVFLGPSITNIMIIIGLTSWPDIARIIRAEVMSIKKAPYIDATRVLGLPKKMIIAKHIMPNALGPVFVYMIFGVSGAILTESGLSFLGLGVQPPAASWGNILSSGKDYIETGWWLTAFPGLAIFLAVFSYNLLGEGLRDFFNPKLSR